MATDPIPERGIADQEDHDGNGHETFIVDDTVVDSVDVAAGGVANRRPEPYPKCGSECIERKNFNPRISAMPASTPLA